MSYVKDDYDREQECPFCMEYGVPKKIVFVEKKELKFLIDSVNLMLDAHYHDNHGDEFYKIEKRYEKVLEK